MTPEHLKRVLEVLGATPFTSGRVQIAWYLLRINNRVGHVIIDASGTRTSLMTIDEAALKEEIRLYLREKGYWYYECGAQGDGSFWVKVLKSSERYHIIHNAPSELHALCELCLKVDE